MILRFGKTRAVQVQVSRLRYMRAHPPAPPWLDISKPHDPRLCPWCYAGDGRDRFGVTGGNTLTP